MSRLSNGHFAPGYTANPGGRPAIPDDVRAMFRNLVPDAVKALHAAVNGDDPRLSPAKNNAFSRPPLIAARNRACETFKSWHSSTTAKSYNEPETPTKDKTSHKLFVDGKLQSPPALPSLKLFLESWLPIEIKGPAKMKPDTIADFTIGAPEGAVVYIEATAGIINRMRARDGQKFSLETRGLETGEEIAIKAGYKFWPGVAEKRVVLT